jgi:hypothetical protein
MIRALERRCHKSYSRCDWNEVTKRGIVTCLECKIGKAKHKNVKKKSKGIKNK